MSTKGSGGDVKVAGEHRSLLLQGDNVEGDCTMNVELQTLCHIWGRGKMRGNGT